jgi:hypothetical protein
MGEVKGQAIFLSIVGICTLLVAIVGATFAWFSITVTGNENPADIVINSGTLGQVNFNDGTAIDIKSLMPGNFTTKTFTVSQTDPSATGKISYNIVLNVKANTLTPVAQGAFIHSLKSTGNTNGGTLATMNETEVPENSFIIGSGVIEGYESHQYEYTIGLKNLNINQNAAQGKTFSGYLSVVLTNDGIQSNN